jgi:hypothetical protein
VNSSRSIGRRTQRPPGMLRPPTHEEREWVKAMARRRTRVPKGVFRYRCIEEANEDWERWHVDTVADAVSVSGVS